MARLAEKTVAEVQANRLEVARSFAQKHGVTLVLKGWRTLIAHPDGRVAVNTTGNPAMAKGGSGDMLTGLVAGLLAQYPQEPARAVEAAVYLHGLAADLAVREADEHTLLATDTSARIFSGFSLSLAAAERLCLVAGALASERSRLRGTSDEQRRTHCRRQDSRVHHPERRGHG